MRILNRAQCLRVASIVQLPHLLLQSDRVIQLLRSHQLPNTPPHSVLTFLSQRSLSFASALEHHIYIVLFLALLALSVTLDIMELRRLILIHR